MLVFFGSYRDGLGFIRRLMYDPRAELCVPKLGHNDR